MYRSMQQAYATKMEYLYTKSGLISEIKRGLEECLFQRNIRLLVGYALSKFYTEVISFNNECIILLGKVVPPLLGGVGVGRALSESWIFIIIQIIVIYIAI